MMPDIDARCPSVDVIYGYEGMLLNPIRKIVLVIQRNLNLMNLLMAGQSLL